tara:strand:+ start:1527 stop:1739 length:213 start_codon:yes stop_codon:yes gene_type:complete
MPERNDWWNNEPPIFKYKIPKYLMERDGKVWKRKHKTEEELDDYHMVSEINKRKRETAMWEKVLDGKRFT